MSLCVTSLCVACAAPAGRVTLLPQPTTSSAVVVTTPLSTTELSTPYASAELDSQGIARPVQSSEAEVRERYPQLLLLQPPAPQRFTLNFQPGSSTLTPQSQEQLEAIVAAARARSGGEIVVVGHTDRQGTTEANDELSLRRAVAIRDILGERGFKMDLIHPIGRGEREPLVPTEDEVVEPRNRRADVIVR